MSLSPTLKKRRKRKREKKRKKEKERMNEEIKKKGGKERKKKREKEKKGGKKKNLAQLSCCCLPPRVTWCSGLVLSFHSLPLLPAGGWNREILSREQRTRSPEGCSISSKKGEKKKKNAASTPAASKVPIPSAGYLE